MVNGSKRMRHLQICGSRKWRDGSCRLESRVKITNGSVTQWWAGRVLPQTGLAQLDRYGAPAVFWICSLRMRILCRCSGGNMAICSGVSCRTCMMRAAWRTKTEKGGQYYTINTHRRTKHLKRKSKVCLSGLTRHLFSLCCTINKQPL